jgi:diguanylate cyclase (GGDEF)-like protein
VPGPRLSLALIDLDDFKTINDTLGQTAGDEVLKVIGKRLTNVADDRCRIYRVAGDEFVALSERCADPLVITQTVDELLRSIAEPIEVGGQRLFVGASAGVAIAPAHGKSPDELIASADLALQEAKTSGGGSQHMFVPMLRVQAQARRVLDLEMRRAFGDQEFEVFFQPQVRLTDGVIVGAEALLRWRHPEKGIVAPGAFIDALSKNAISREVGRWVLHTACTQAALWQRYSREGLRMGVNIFPSQFQESILVEDVEKALHLSKLPATLLEIEITENIALRHDDELLAPLVRLRDEGVRLAFDDFGTGYASLSYLRRYPLNRIKIDRSFVQKIEDERGQDAAIVRSIIAMAHNLGLEVIAEGVETDHQAEFLKREQCDEAQGYLYGRPVPAAEFERLLAGGGASIEAVA